MIKIIGYIVLFVILTASFIGHSQNDAHYSHFNFNPFILNPASVPRDNKIDICLLGRKQWYGFPTSPANQMVCGKTYYKDMYGGMGLLFNNDQLGEENIFNLRASYNYYVRLNRQHLLSLGLGLGFINNTVDGSQLRYADYDDPMAITDKYSHFAGDASFGAEVNSKYYNYTAGLAISHLNKVFKMGKKGRQKLELEPASHIYTYGTYYYQVNDEVKIEPTLLIKSSVFITQFEMNCIASFNRDLWYSGLTYRLSDALVVMGGYNFKTTNGRNSTRYRHGYAYEFSVGMLRTYNNGSHEIMYALNFDGFTTERIKPPSPGKLFY